MDSRNNLYKEHEAFERFIENGFEADVEEDLSPTETIAVSSLERQKATLEAQRVKLDQQLKDLMEKINKLDADIARMKAT